LNDLELDEDVIRDRQNKKLKVAKKRSQAKSSFANLANFRRRFGKRASAQTSKASKGSYGGRAKENRAFDWGTKGRISFFIAYRTFAQECKDKAFRV
jgi:hypothetical protein